MTLRLSRSITRTATTPLSANERERKPAATVPVDGADAKKDGHSGRFGTHKYFERERLAPKGPAFASAWARRV